MGAYGLVDISYNGYCIPQFPSSTMTGHKHADRSDLRKAI